MSSAKTKTAITITFPDGNSRSFEGPVTGMEIAESISKSLAKEAMVIVVNGEQWDLNRPIEQDAKISIITRKQDEALEIIRHDCAHVMAQAVQELFPGTQVTIGPAIENGFYYDFHREESFTPDDLQKIEKRMHAIIKANKPFARSVVSRDEAVKFFEKLGETFKVELINDLPDSEVITLYDQDGFVDLCRGPHAPTTGKVGKAFKLTKLAGAYWRGDSSRPMLQRIYGTAWASEEQLENYIHQIEEAEKRDHRKLGREMDLFHMQEEAMGSVFWHDKGWTLYRVIEDYIRTQLQRNGYEEVKTPVLVDRKLWEDSGHWEKFRENMFTVEDDAETVLALKPMNCPCHVQIFNQGMKSYRDLPLRMAEFGSCHRNEAHGALHGLMRVRAMTQDDAHIFCTPDQIMEESKAFCKLLLNVYKDFGFEEVQVKFSDRPEVRAGADDVWDKAEEALESVLKELKMEYTLNPGEGAFYGPKLEFVLKDAIGRDWQCGTLQLDFVLPDRLGAHYIGEDGQKHTPVMLHRAIIGTLERFIGILLENYAGKLPMWLAPTQAVVAPITSDVDAYAQKVQAELKKAGLRVDIDLRNEKINYKIREHSLAKTPLILVVGKREEEENKVALRRLGGKDQEIISLKEAVSALSKEARNPLENE